MTLRRRALSVLVLLTVLAATAPLLLLASTSPADAAALPALDAAVAAARERVLAVSREVDQVSAQLVDGTRQWEDGTRALQQALHEAVAATERAELAGQLAERRREALGVVAAAGYRQPVAGSPGLLAVSSPAAGVLRALRAEADLGRVHASQGDALDSATAAGRTAASASAAARRLTDAAHAQERALAGQLTGLTQLADRTAGDLQRAGAELDGAQAARAVEVARLAAERVAAQAERARLDGQAAQRAGITQAPIGAGAPAPGAGGCAGSSTAGYANGAIPASALCPLVDAPGHLLRADAASAFNAMSAAAKADRGSALCVTDSYRSYAQQVDVFRRKPGLAAVPGTSNHGWGVAVDLCGGVESFGSPAHGWLDANAGRFGWMHPGWAEPGGSKPEPWHWEYVG